jgi:hypothetical protein
MCPGTGNQARLAFLPALVLFAACGGAEGAEPRAPEVDTTAPRFDADDRLQPPADYRSWVFLTSGYAMGYGPAAEAARAGGVETFDTVFVEPGAYAGFLDTGVWPEQTMFVLEIRTAEETGSIVNRGRFQTELVAIEAAVKDTQRYDAEWGYFAFDTDAHGPTAPAAKLPFESGCYGCHAANGAVESTFTQFYPTAFEVARAKGTVREDFAGIPENAGELYARIAAKGWSAGEALLADIQTHWPDATVLRESSLNRTGYRLLADGKQAEAIAVFEDITRRFPASANAWDSLSEALEGAGELARAREAVTRGLAALLSDASLSDARRELLATALRDRDARLRR